MLPDGYLEKKQVEAALRDERNSMEALQNQINALQSQVAVIPDLKSTITSLDAEKVSLSQSLARLQDVETGRLLYRTLVPRVFFF
jgi:prefoldin subunit 5